MTYLTNFKLLRNPAVLLALFFVLLLPEFAYLCSVELPFQPFWSDFIPCTQEFVFSVFVEESLLSLFMIVLTFETIIFLQYRLRLNAIPENAKDWLKLQMRSLVPIFLAFSIYLLFTELFKLITSRSLILNVEEITALFSLKKMAFSGFFAINAVLLIQYLKLRKNPGIQMIKARDSFGETEVPVNSIEWFEKEGRHYYANTVDRKLKIKLNLTELETKLKKTKFIRINRSVIANLEEISEYSYWENEKYILRLKNSKEFVVNRNRLKLIKDAMLTLNFNKS